MSTYVIGDVHGCYAELQQLLEKIDYNPLHDELNFVGDVVNRGSDSLQVLRFLKNQPRVNVVLGNHDLYLLILGYGLMAEDAYNHTLQAVMDASDRLDLLDWLRHQRLLLLNENLQSLIVHAGIPPQWTVAESLVHSQEVEQVLQGPDFPSYLSNLFGNEPANWSDQLQGQSRLRYITNALTRMRFCQQDGCLEFSAQDVNQVPALGFRPWFEWRQQDHHDILFGHWAVLDGRCEVNHCYALDTGCVWGRALTAIRLEDKSLFSVDASFL